MLDWTSCVDGLYLQCLKVHHFTPIVGGQTSDQQEKEEQLWREGGIQMKR